MNNWNFPYHALVKHFKDFKFKEVEIGVEEGEMTSPLPPFSIMVFLALFHRVHIFA